MEIAEGELHRMSRACGKCGCTEGVLSPRNGQICCFCRDCGKLVYNVPRHELGLKPQPMRDDGVSESTRYEVMERASFRCEFCGTDASKRTMVLAHLLSQKDIRTGGLPLRSANDIENLAWLCDECNAGMADKSVTPHQYLVLQWRRRLNGGT